MNSTLFVFITIFYIIFHVIILAKCTIKQLNHKNDNKLRTMTDNGEAYIITLKTQQTIPTVMERLSVVCWRVSTKTVRIAINAISHAKTALITNRCFLRPEKTKKMVTNTISITIPVPLIVTTNKLSGCTIGIP